MAEYGYNRDGKKDKEIIVYGALCDEAGRPVSIQVYPGNTGDSTTVPDQVKKLQDIYGLKNIVFLGDRGMLTETRIEELKKHPGIEWISALRSQAIKKLVKEGAFQPSLFDEYSLAEIKAEQFPGERLIVCFNPILSEERGRKREALLKETEKLLAKVVSQVNRRTNKKMDKLEISQKVGKIINRYKMEKHFKLEIEDGKFGFTRDEEAIKMEKNLDGIYIIRTNDEDMSAEDIVRNYKNLSQVERLFRTLKGIEIKIRPIRHRLDTRVMAHIFINMLAYYVEWHMRHVLKPLLFDDEELDKMRWTREPVAPAKISQNARIKKNSRETQDGFEIQSFETLLADLGTLCWNKIRIKGLENIPARIQYTEKTPLQKKVFELLDLLPVY